MIINSRSVPGYTTAGGAVQLTFPARIQRDFGHGVVVRKSALLLLHVPFADLRTKTTPEL
jgi:hypothetical protein